MRQPGVGASLDCSGFGRGPGWRGRSSRAASVAEGAPVRDGVPAGEQRHGDAQSRAGSLSGQRTEFQPWKLATALCLGCLGQRYLTPGMDMFQYFNNWLGFNSTFLLVVSSEPMNAVVVIIMNTFTIIMAPRGLELWPPGQSAKIKASPGQWESGAWPVTLTSLS